MDTIPLQDRYLLERGVSDEKGPVRKIDLSRARDRPADLGRHLIVRQAGRLFVDLDRILNMGGYPKYQRGHDNESNPERTQHTR